MSATINTKAREHMMKRSEDYLRLFFIILFSRKKFILTMLAVFSVLTIAVAYVVPPVYELTGSVLLKSKEIELPPENSPSGSVTRTLLPPSREDVLSEINIITSREVISAAVEELYAKGVFNEDPPPPVVRMIKEYALVPLKDALVYLAILPDVVLAPTEKLTNDVIDALSAEVQAGSNVITVSLFWDKPDVGAQVMNSVLAHYLQARLKIYTSQSSEGFFAQQHQNYLKKIEELQSEKVALLQSHSMLNMDQDLNAQTTKINDISASLRTLQDDIAHQRSDLVFLRKVYADAQKGGMKPFPYEFEEGKLRDFNERLNKLMFDQSDMLKTYKPGSPVIQQLDQQIASMRSQLLYLVKGEIDGKQQRLTAQEELAASKQQMIDGLLKQNQQLAAAKVDLERLDDSIRLNERNLETFFIKMEEAKIAQEAETAKYANVQIIGWASPPIQPFFPKRIIVIPLGIITGIILGFSLAYVWELFNHTFRTPDQVNTYLDLPVIGSIPEGARLENMI